VSSLIRISLICVICGLIFVLCHAQSDTFFSEWRPNFDPRGIRFVGSKACVDCHPKESVQLNTPMAHALEVAPDCKIVSARGKLSFKNGPYTYELARQASSVVYTVSDGTNRITTPILYCFGEGHVGQTYLFRYNNLLYETRVSFFQKLRGLGFTIGHSPSVPTTLESALGRAIGGDEPRQCFGCHTTGTVQGLELKLDQLRPGIQCEACHGPGEKHLVAMKDKKFDEPQIFNPGGLGAHELSQSFCGTCHTSFEQTMLMPGQSFINNIRFQPYRMFNSRGHNTNDPRVGCLACHNPHEKLQKDTAYYDSKCLACHLTKPGETKTERRSAAACPVSTKKCATCHMPKVELQGMHADFTDHWIRIAKPGEPAPR
jgi:hypothetical protein